MRRFAWIFIVLVACFDSAGPGINFSEGDTHDSVTDLATATDTDIPKLDRSILGQWYDCIGRIEFKADNTFIYNGLDDNCTTTGTYTFLDYILDLSVKTTTCPTMKTDRQADFLLQGMAVNIADSIMQWTHPDLDNSTKVWLRKKAFIAEKWLIYDQSHKQGQDLRVCFTKAQKFIQGFYFRTNTPETLLSNSGHVERVEPMQDKPDTWQVRTTCRGYCFCAGILKLHFTGSDIDGTYRSINCDQSKGPDTVEGDKVQWTGYSQ